MARSVVDIGAADPGGFNAHDHLARTRLRVGKGHRFEGRTDLAEAGPPPRSPPPPLSGPPGGVPG